MKRFISIVLVLAMLLCDIPVYAYGGEENLAGAPVAAETIEGESNTAAPENGETAMPEASVAPAAEEPDSEEQDEPEAEKTGEKEEAAEKKELSLSVSALRDAVLSNGSAHFYVSASLSGDGAEEHSVSYTWQYCVSADGLSAVASNPDMYTWNNVAHLPGVSASANGGSLVLSGDASAFDGVYFRCVAEAAGLTAASGVAVVNAAAPAEAALAAEAPQCEHNWLPGKYHPATCEEDGFNAKTCTECGYIDEATKVYDPGSPKHNSNLDWSNPRTTCTDGYASYLCLACEGIAVRTKDDAHGDGVSHVYENGSCIVLGCNAVQHTWDDGEVTTPPTCGQPGEKTYHCTDEGCTKTKTESIPSTVEHTWAAGEPVLPTCTEGGYTPWSCNACGQVRRTEVVSALGHTPGEWEVDVPADCTKPGSEKRECTFCHSEESCETREIPALGHDWDDGEVNVPASCTQEGEKLYICRREGCSETKTEPIPMLDHTKGELISSTPATCQQDGVNTYECSVCHGQIYETVPKDENAHTWTEWNETAPATCQNDGEEERHCANSGCTAAQLRVIPSAPEAHTWSQQWETVLPATCRSAGLEKRSCLNDGCEASETREPIIDHRYVNHICEYCHLSYPKTEEVRSRIEALPDPYAAPAEVTVKNVDSVMKDIEEILGIMSTMTDNEMMPLEHEYEGFVGLLEKLNDLYDLCRILLEVTRYEPEQGKQVYTVTWNDNNSTDIDLRTPADEFLTAAGATLSYTITSKDGSVTVAGGELPLTGAAEALQEAFGFLYPAGYEFPDAPISCTGYGNTAYQIETDERLPVSYTATYTDYATMEQVSEKFVISYQLSLNNPASDNYVYTQPAAAGGTVTVNDGDNAILTKLITWNALVLWRDDSNRSASGGATDAADSPRVSADDFKNGTEVHCYVAGAGSDSSAVVTGEYGYTVTEGTDGNEWNVSLSDLPAYDNEGSILNYFIVQKNGRLDAANGSGDYYYPSYNNIGNYASKLNGLYEGGAVTEMLRNYVPFTVSKVWDDVNGSDRPDAKLYIWRTTETYDEDGNLTVDTNAAYAVPDTHDSVDVPKEADAGELIEISFGSDEANFPKYDSYGRRYVYYGVEKGLTGSYHLTINNYTTAAAARNSAAVLDVLSGSRYFVNGAKLTNSSDNYAAPVVSKSFVAASLQSSESMSATFLLQKKEVEGEWVNVTAEDVLSARSSAVVTADGIFVTLTGFDAANMSDSSAPVTVRNFDDYYNVIRYRWVETGVSVNGGSASMDAAGWNNEGKYAGQVVLKDGDAQSGPMDTTIIFTAAADGSDVTNTLVGNNQVQIKKYWYNEYGQSIADPEKNTDPAYDFIKNASARFRVNRSDGATTENRSLKDINGNEMGDVFLTAEDLFRVDGDTDYWTRVLNLPRYDAEGNEYYYTVQELTIDGTTDIGWLKDQRYETEIFEQDGIWMKRIVSIHTNTMGTDGAVLTFDVTKLWQDGSHVDARHPVNARIYRVCDVLGNEITPVPVTGIINLSDSNNWYEIRKISAAPAQTDPDTGETVTDSVKNYIVIEEGISVNDSNVPLDRSESLAALSEALNSTVGSERYVGTVGTPSAVGASWDGLDYIYRVTECIINTGDKEYSDSAASYTLTNTRTALQDYELTKTWNAGSAVKGCGFGLFNGSTKLAEFTIRKVTADDGSVTLVFDRESDYVKHFDQDPGSDYSGIKTPTFTYGKDPNSGNYRAYITFGNLPKFDYAGEQNDISIREIYMIDDGGNRIDVVSSTADVDGVRYSVSASSSASYADQDQHRSGDLIRVSIVNSRSDSYSLTSNKVWRDDNSNIRPDVSFTVKRLAAKGELLDYVNDGNTAAVLAYVKSHAGSAESVMSDCYWNTKVNTYFWTCSTDAVPQYDANGYPYVYFAVENKTGGNVNYQAYYCNLTASDGYRPQNAPEPTEAEKEQGISWTEKVFAVQDELVPAEGNYFLLADGVNGREGGYENYYSATVVNRPEMTRTVSGTKIWKLPLGWTVPEDQFPAVEVSLYRSTKSLLTGSFSDADEYVQAVIDAAEIVDVITRTVDISGGGADGKVIDTENINYQTHYNFSFPTDDSYVLDKYNKWGTVYHYYTIEQVSSPVANFPSKKTVYEDHNFNITNVFAPEPPYVEVTVKKVWDISGEEQYASQIRTLADIDTSGLKLKLCDAVINLYGSATTGSGSQWEPIGSNTQFGSVTLSPTAEGNQIVKNSDGTIATVTASYTFRSYTDENGEQHRLPYYWITDKPMWYSLTENRVDGYRQGDEGDEVKNGEVVFVPHVEFTSSEERDGVQVWSNDPNDSTVSNIYFGDTKDLIFMKKWDDAYVDNGEYRPATVALLIHRSSDATVVYDDAYNKGTYSTELNNYVLLNKEEKPHLALWAGRLENLLKYDPQGNEYTYYIYGEAINPGVEDGVLNLNAEGCTVVYRDGADRQIGEYYELTDVRNSMFTNSFFEQVKVSVSAAKTWMINNQTLSGISYDEFTKLRNMGVLPRSVQYILLRSTDGSEWNTVGAESESQDGTSYDSAHVTEYNGQMVLGRTVNLASANSTNYREIFNSRLNWSNLPKYASKDVKYSYKVGEIVTWSDGSGSGLIPVDGVSTGNMTAEITGSQNENTGDWSFSLTNTLATTKIRLAKQWKDDNGQDNTRPSYIILSIRPDGAQEADAISVRLVANETRAAADAGTGYDPYADIYYSTTWIDIPQVSRPSTDIVFGQDSGNTYVITENMVYESGREQYRVLYNAQIDSSSQGAVRYNHNNNTYTLVVSNEFLPDSGFKTVDLTAAKTWKNDNHWENITRPEISYKLQYQEHGGSAWKDFEGERGTIPEYFSVDELQAVKPVTKQTDGTYKAEWTGMRKYWSDPAADGVAELINYRVIEVIDGNRMPEKGYVVNDADSTFNVSASEAATKAYASITNDLRTAKIRVIKTWTTGGYTLTVQEIKDLVAIDALPYKLNFQLQYSVNGGANWYDMKSAYFEAHDGKVSMDTVKLAKAGADGMDFGYDLPIYAEDGTPIQYRVLEVSMTYKTGTVTVSGGKAGDVSVTDSAASDIVSENTRTYALSNSYTSGRLIVEKLWNDSNDRDGMRPTMVTMRLFRDGKKDNKAYNISITGIGASDNSATATLNHMPVYKNGSASVHSDYSFYEVLSSDCYTTTYSANGGSEVTAYSAAVVYADMDDPGRITVRNVHRSLMAVESSKIWNDANNAYEQRPDYVDLTLQYSTDGINWNPVTKKVEVIPSEVYRNDTVTPNADNGTAVFTTSDLTQRLTAPTQPLNGGNTAEEWGTARWENLPTHMLVDGTTKQISYRAYDSVTGYNYSCSPVTASGTDEAQKADVTNTAAAKANVTKIWSEAYYSWLTRPDSVQVCLEARLKGSDDDYARVANSERDLTPNNSWKAEWNDLSDAYEYRVKEVSVKYGETVVNSAGSTESGTVGTYAYTSAVTSSTKSNITTTTGTLTNTPETVSLAIDKNWLAENNRDGISSVTVRVKRDGEIMKAADGTTELTWKITAANNWKLTIDNLPKYKNDAAEQNEAYVSVYEVIEDELTNVADPTQSITNNKGRVNITNSYTPQRGNLSVTKSWNDMNNAFASRPEYLYFKLQFNYNGEWVDVPTGAIGENGLYVVDGVPLSGTRAATTSAPNVEGTAWHEVTAEAGWKYTWKDLPVNILNASGKSVPAEYRVREGLKVNDTITEIDAGGDLNGYTVSYSNAVLTVADKQTKATTVTNTLVLKPLTVSKTWVEPTGMAELVRPDSVTFKVEYRLGSTGTWATLPADITVSDITASEITVNGAKTAGTWSLTTGSLPAMAADGTKYEYRVTEAYITYGGTKVSVAADGKFGAYETEEVTRAFTEGADAFTAAMSNTMIPGSMAVEKVWDDENNRDAGKKESVELGIYRRLTSGSTTAEQLVTKVTLSSDNDWTQVISNLPARDNITGVKSEYLVKETGESDGSWTGNKGVVYAVTYSANVTLAEGSETVPKLTVTNTHVPYVGTVTASKVWKDDNNRYHSRPESITFELQWNDSGVWRAVKTEHSDTGVYTESANPQTLTGSTLEAVFEGVPVNLNGQQVSYRIVEKYAGSDSDKTGYTTAYSAEAVTLTDKDDAETVTVTNTLKTGKLTLSKKWSQNENLEPVSADFSVWYMIGKNGTWTALLDDYGEQLTVTLNSDNGWMWEMSGVPVADAAGTEYFYGFKETSVEYKVYGKKITAEAAEASFGINSWTGVSGCYDAVIAGEKTESDGETVFSFTAENTAETGSIILTKSWHDAANRDNDREAIKIQLIRDGADYGDVVTITAADDWSAEFDKLPVYKDNSRREKSVYTFREIGEQNFELTNEQGRVFTVAYSDVAEADTSKKGTLTVTNTRPFDVFDVKAGKSWIDNTNYYGLRSTSVELKLQYSVDGKASWQDVAIQLSNVPSPEEDDGTRVFTTSDLVQPLTGSSTSNEWGTVLWKDLPANVKVNGVSTKVYYRIAETEESIAASGYDSVESDAVCYDNAVLTNGRLTADSGSVENELTDTCSLKVVKTWDGGGTYDAWPDKVLVTLQVSTDGGGTWNNVQNCIDVELTADNSWSFTFSELRKNPGYTYRAIETAIVYLANAEKGTPAETFTMKYSADDLSAGRAGSYDMTTELSYDEASAQYTADITNVYNPEEVELVIEARKNIIGDKRLVKTEIQRFTFVLTDDDGNTMKASVVDEGTAQFEKLTFNRPGIYTYTIKEVNDWAENYTYDTSTHTVEITVTDTNGILSLSWTGDGEDEQVTEFTNEYKVPGELKAPGGIPLHEGYCFD